jgi:hypothetical protein
MFFRTLFATGWMIWGYVLWSDRKKIVEEFSTLDPGEAKPKASASYE